VEKQLMDQLLAHGVQRGASDIHFKVGDRPAYRIDGTLRSVNHETLTPAHTRRIAEQLVGDRALDQDLDSLQECDTSYSIEGIARFRVNIYRQRGTLCCILRIIPREIPTIESLGLPSRVAKIADEERGLILVTGATGSGKSSTLAALIERINRSRAAHILTIEDPIEFLYTNQKASISQREVGSDTRNFTQALRSALRQDPDVILVGEMRDAETIDIALKAAETGHLVLSTVHTTDAAKTVGRLVGTFPAEEQHGVRLRLADNLRGVVSQRLLPRKDGKGRVVAAEIMVSTKTVQEYVKDASKSADLKDVIEQGADQYGMQSFDQHLTALLRGGEISMEVAKSAASNAADFERALSFDDGSAALDADDDILELDNADEE
jgi:twitching motility protein PilT